MTRKLEKAEALAKLAEIAQNDDIEEAHCDADAVLCDLLTAIGYGEVVAEYRKIEKWYA
jgi:hypothetical protein